MNSAMFKRNVLKDEKCVSEQIVLSSSLKQWRLGNPDNEGRTLTENTDYFRMETVRMLTYVPYTRKILKMSTFKKIPPKIYHKDLRISGILKTKPQILSLHFEDLGYVDILGFDDSRIFCLYGTCVRRMIDNHVSMARCSYTKSVQNRA